MPVRTHCLSQFPVPHLEKKSANYQRVILDKYWIRKIEGCILSPRKVLLLHLLGNHLTIRIESLHQQLKITVKFSTLPSKIITFHWQAIEIKHQLKIALLYHTVEVSLVLQPIIPHTELSLPAQLQKEVFHSAKAIKECHSGMHIRWITDVLHQVSIHNQEVSQVLRMSIGLLLGQQLMYTIQPSCRSCLHLAVVSCILASICPRSTE